MLAVAVELDIHVIAVEKRVFVACLDAAADAEVLGEGQNVESVSVAYRQRFVRRAIVYDNVIVSCSDHASHA